jgi:hypothetical protein
MSLTEKSKLSKLDSMKDLKDLLPAITFSKTTDRTPKTMTTERRQKIAKQEVEQFKNVLAHPAFKNNALATITEHLTNRFDYFVEITN